MTCTFCLARVSEMDSRGKTQDSALFPSITKHNLDGIVRQMFNFTEEDNFNDLIQQIRNFIEQNQLFRDIFRKLLNVYITVRPKKVENYINLQKSLSLLPLRNSQSSKSYYIQIPETKLSNLIKEDDVYALQRIVLGGKEFDDDDTELNPFALSAFYGSIKCFLFFLLNDFAISKRVCVYAFAGGNNEIINHVINIDFDFTSFSSLIFKTAVSYHQYEITETFLNIFHYSPDISDVETAIQSFNFVTLINIENYIPSITIDDIFLLCIRSENYFLLEARTESNVLSTLEDLSHITGNPSLKVKLFHAYLYFLTKDVKNPDDLISIIKNIYYNFI